MFSEPKIITSLDYLRQAMKSFAPNAADEFIPILIEALDLHNRKNRDYTHGEAPYGNFERVAKIFKLYPTFPHQTPEGVCVAFMLKQLDAIFNSLGRRSGLKEEGLESRVFDVGVYAFILIGMLRASKKGEGNANL